MTEGVTPKIKRRTRRRRRPPPFPPRAALPREIWAMIIICLRDRKSQAELAYLRQTVRPVSTLFKAEIERLFVEYHLEKTTIFADCGGYCIECQKVRGRRCYCTSGRYNDIRSCVQIGDVPFTFSRLNDDVPDRAVFKLNNTCEYTTDDYLLHAICYQMGAKYNTAVDNLERIPAVCTDVRNYEEGKSLFVMQMRGGLCDGLTGFSVNEKAREISAPWKGLLSSFFGQKTAAANLSNAKGLPGPQKISWSLYEVNTCSADMVLFDIRWSRDQIKSWRAWCEEFCGELSFKEKLRKRQAADRGLHVDDEGRWGPVYDVYGPPASQGL